MEITLLIKSIVGLVVVLFILMFFLLYSPSAKRKKELEKTTVKEREINDLESLKKIIKNKLSTKEDLSNAVNLVLKHHGTIHPKLGTRTHPDFNVYEEILFAICRHPNTNKTIILKFDKELEAKNPAYKKEINDALTRGLNSRGM